MGSDTEQNSAPVHPASKLLQRLGPQWATRLMLGYTTVEFVWSKAIGTIYGVAAITVALYLLRWEFGDPAPWTAQQMAVWVAELPTSVASAIAASLIAVVGFLIAFRTAASSWKAAAKAKLYESAAADYEEFFAEVTALLSSASVYVDSLLDIAKHAPLLNSIWRVPECVRGATDALARLLPTLQVFEPAGDPEDQTVRALFIEWVDIRRCQTSVRAFDREFPLMNGLAGAARAVLLGDVIEHNTPALLRLLSKRKTFPEMLAKLSPTTR